MKKYLIVLTVLSTYIYARLLPFALNPSFKSPSISILDSYEVTLDAKDGVQFCELSDLAYSVKRGLYGVSDEGFLYKFTVEIKDEKLKKFTLKKGYKLKDAHKRRLKKKYRDSEGLVMAHDKLYISFERHPRVERFSFKGKYKQSIPIHPDLKEVGRYAGKNKMLEALAYHPNYGFITAPEAPLDNKKFHTLYAQDKTFRIKEKGEITALEVKDKTHMLVLERHYTPFIGTSVYLSLVDIENCGSTFCKSTKLLTLHHTENFEALTHLYKNYYLLGADDNNSPLQKSVVVLLKIP